MGKVRRSSGNRIRNKHMEIAEMREGGRKEEQTKQV
jgi:hypothetical protein